MFFVVEDFEPNLVSITAQHIIISSERERVDWKKSREEKQVFVSIKMMFCAALSRNIEICPQKHDLWV